MRPASTLLRTISGRRVLPALALLGVALAPLSGCTSAQMAGQSSSYLIIQSLEGANGATPEELTTSVPSDALTMVKRQINGQEVMVPTRFEDPGVVTFRLGMKNPTLEPTATNFITVTRYRVDYVRTDGRNTPGVDVPYGFQGGMTATVTDDVVAAPFGLVRIQAKLEAPLLPLVNMGGSLSISTIAEVTFYGTDQAGREVSVSGRISVNFADWGDPD